MPVPPYLTPGVIARASKQSWDKTFRQLKAAGLVDDDKRGRLHRISRSRLRERLPDLFDDVFEYYDGLSASDCAG